MQRDWLRLRLLAEALVPGLFIWFSLSFARTNYREFRAPWRPVIALFFVAPLGILAARWSGLLVRNLYKGKPPGARNQLRTYSYLGRKCS